VQIAALERRESDDLIGMSLEEAKTMTGSGQRILGSVLPLQHATSITTWKRQVARVGARLDEEAHHPHSSQPSLNELHLLKRNPLRAVRIGRCARSRT
jgi:hypothetical protein